MSPAGSGHSRPSDCRWARSSCGSSALINTGTTIVTFLMVFIIQNTQNREGRAMQAKLDAQSEVLRLIAGKLEVDDDEDLLTRLVGVEDAPETIIKEDQDRVRAVATIGGGHGTAVRRRT